MAKPELDYEKRQDNKWMVGFKVERRRGDAGGFLAAGPRLSQTLLFALAKNRFTFFTGEPLRHTS